MWLSLFIPRLSLLFLSRFFKMFCLGILILFRFLMDSATARRLIVERRFDIQGDDFMHNSHNFAQAVNQDNTLSLESESSLIDSQHTPVIANSPDFHLNSQEVSSDEEYYLKKDKPTNSNTCGTTDPNSAHIYLTCGGPAGGNIENPFFVANCMKGKL